MAQRQVKHCLYQSGLKMCTLSTLKTTSEDVIDQSMLVLVYLVFVLQHCRGQVLTECQS